MKAPLITMALIVAASFGTQVQAASNQDIGAAWAFAKECAKRTNDSAMKAKFKSYQNTVNDAINALPINDKRDADQWAVSYMAVAYNQSDAELQRACNQIKSNMGWK